MAHGPTSTDEYGPVSGKSRRKVASLFEFLAVVEKRPSLLYLNGFFVNQSEVIAIRSTESCYGFFRQRPGFIKEYLHLFILSEIGRQPTD